MAKPTDPASRIYRALQRIRTACVDCMADVDAMDADELKQYRADLLLVHELSNIKGES